jgi:hypothetical protein
VSGAVDRACLRCGADLTDRPGVTLFVVRDGRVAHALGEDEPLCVGCGANGANTASDARLARLRRARGRPDVPGG